MERSQLLLLFCTCVADVKPLNKAWGPHYSTGQMNTRRGFLSCGDNKSHKISNGMPDCKRLLWSKPLLISSSDANLCQSFLVVERVQREMLTSPAFLHLYMCTCLRKPRNDGLDSKMTGWGCLVCGLLEAWTRSCWAGNLRMKIWKACGVCSTSCCWDQQRLGFKLLKLQARASQQELNICHRYL